MLAHILAGLKGTPVPPELLVGFDLSDDAAVYRLTDDIALIQTVDFFTPVVDDPYQFGAIAAANALSDVYAMGGEPFLALNIVCWPDGELPVEWLEAVLQGGADKAAEANVVVGGGHSISDKEPKYGMSVSGRVHPARIWRNHNPRIGDLLILTKAVGTGVLSTAFKRAHINAAQFEPAINNMMSLNREAMAVARNHDISAATDITGFGLLGHLYEMIDQTRRVARIWAEQVPLLSSALSQTKAGSIPGGTRRNLDRVSPHCHFNDKIDGNLRILLADAQTSGGLLLAIAADSADACLRELHERGVSHSTIIGEIAGGRQPAIYVDC